MKGGTKNDPESFTFERASFQLRTPFGKFFNFFKSGSDDLVPSFEDNVELAIRFRDKAELKNESLSSNDKGKSKTFIVVRLESKNEALASLRDRDDGSGDKIDDESDEVDEESKSEVDERRGRIDVENEDEDNDDGRDGGRNPPAISGNDDKNVSVQQKSYGRKPSTIERKNI